MVQDFIFVKKNGRFERINFSELVYVKGMRGYSQVVTDSSIYFVLNSMEEIQKHLPENMFCRVHRSFIVCINRIRAFDTNKIFLSTPSESDKNAGFNLRTELPVGRAFQKKLRNSVNIIPNKMNKYIKKILSNAEFLNEVGLDED